MASEAIVSCRLLLWRDSLSKMSVNDHDCEMLYDDDADDLYSLADKCHLTGQLCTL